MKIPEIEAIDILSRYSGYNNYILELKRKHEIQKNFKLTRPQAEYIIKYHEVVPKFAKKYVNILGNFGEKLMNEKHLTTPPKKVWVEKLLCESDLAYNVWGKLFESEKLSSMWIPKASVVPTSKPLKEIDLSKYDKPNRKLMEHQKIAIRTLVSNDRFILADDMGLGKSLSINTLVITPNGRKKIGEINIGDKVIGSDGLSYNVIGVFPQGKRKLFRITFNDGFSILSDEEHLWSVMSPNYSLNRNNERIKKSIVLSTKQMMDKNGIINIDGNGYNLKKEYKINTYYKSNNGNNKWQIPIVKPIIFNNNTILPINPYLLGLALGDGSFKGKNIKFSVHKDDYDELFKNFNFKENKPNGNKRNGYINVNNSLFELGIEHTRSHIKFIPDIYKYSSIDNRLSILQGLMDTDGYCMKSKTNKYNGAFYCTVSEKLCDDLIEIVHSLGGIARKSSRITKYTYKGEKKDGKLSYNINIKLPLGMIPFRLKRKLDLYNYPQKYPVGRYISNIEYETEDDAVCISVDSPDRLYVAEHCIVTHNTTSAVVASLELNVKKVLVVCTASLKINWMREIQMYTNKKIFIVEGKKWGSTFDYYIINYDILKNYHTLEDNKNEKDEDIKLIQNMKFDLAIVDEAHNISNKTAKRTQIMNEILKDIPNVWLMTGTPMTSRPINYFNLLEIVKSPITSNWQTYVRRYCGGFRFKAGTKKVWNTSGATNLSELREATQNIILRRLKTEILDLPEKIVTPIYLELFSTYYNEEFDEFLKIAHFQKNKESLSITLNRLMKARQIIAIEKLPYTYELIDKFIEQDKKVIVFTNFTATLDMIHEKYKNISVVLDGRMNKTQKQNSIDKFQTESKIKVFVANLKAGGTGHNLTEAEGVIMNDLCFVPGDHVQGEDRAFRIGQKNTVLVYYPIFENTIERIIYNILIKKKNDIDEVMGDGEYSEGFAKEVLKELF